MDLHTDTGLVVDVEKDLEELGWPSLLIFCFLHASGVFCFYLNYGSVGFFLMF